jgi:hypothetical protein
VTAGCADAADTACCRPSCDRFGINTEQGGNLAGREQSLANLHLDLTFRGGARSGRDMVMIVLEHWFVLVVQERPN